MNTVEPLNITEVDDLNFSHEITEGSNYPCHSLMPVRPTMAVVGWQIVEKMAKIYYLNLIVAPRKLDTNPHRTTHTPW